MSASGSALQVLKTCMGLPWRTASWNREAFMRYPPRVSPVVLLCVCHTSRGTKVTGRRQNQWGRNSRDMRVCLREGQEGRKPKENSGGGSGLWYWSAPWGTADGWQREWSQENHTCKVPARANNRYQATLGAFKDPALMVMQRNSGWNWSRASPWINQHLPIAVPREQDDAVWEGTCCTVLSPRTKDFNTLRANHTRSLSAPNQIFYLILVL